MTTPPSTTKAMGYMKAPLLSVSRANKEGLFYTGYIGDILYRKKRGYTIEIKRVILTGH